MSETDEDFIHQHRVKWHTAEEQVEAFLVVLSRRYNIKEDEIPELIETVRWSMKNRDRIEKARSSVLLAIITTGVGGVLYALVEGAKHIFGKP